MNYYNETEKSLKRYLKDKVKITASTIVGFLIMGTIAFGADKEVNINSNFNGANVIESVINGDISGLLGNTGVEIGKVAGENVSIIETSGVTQLPGSLVNEISNIGNNIVFSDEKQEISIKIPGTSISVPIPISESMTINLNPIKNNMPIEKAISGDVELNIGDKDNSPLIVGGVAGDLSTSIGAWKLDVEESGDQPNSSTTIKLGEEEATIDIFNDKFILGLDNKKYTVTRDGNITVTATNGDILGLSTGSTALSLGNMGVSKKNLGIQDFDITGNIFNVDEILESLDLNFLEEKLVKLFLEGILSNINIEADLNLMDVNLQFAGNTETIVNGDTTLNIKDKATVLGATAGGTALGMGGTAVSTVKGNTTINIESTDNLLNGDGITAGIFGGGVAVSTLGGSATTNSNVNNNTSTDITVNSGATGMLVGGGLAASTDIGNSVEKIISLIPEEYRPTINEKGDIVVSLDEIIDIDSILGSITGTTEEGSLTESQLNIINSLLGQLTDIKLNISGLKDGGTSISNVGDVNIALNGNTTAMGVIGGGIAVANQNAISEKVSTSIVTGKDGKITINLDTNEGFNGDVTEVLDSFKNAVSQVINPDNILANIDNPNLIVAEFGKVVEELKDVNVNMAVGVTGNSIAAAFDKGQAEASMETTDIIINNGLVLGVMGNGIALANNNATSVVKVGDTNVTVNNGEVYGITGNGIAIYGDVNGGTGKATVEVENSNIVVTGGNVEGIVAGGMAVSLNTSADRNAEANITGVSTVTVKGGSVDKIGDIVVSPIEDKLSGTDLANLKVLGDKAAIIGGGIAVGNASSNVENSVINVAGGTVNGDIIGGGVAVGTATVTTSTSEINLSNGATVNGDIIAGGIALGGTVKVGTSTVNLDGTTVNGDLYGQGVGADLETVIPMIGDSKLNVIGGENKVDAIYGFTDVTVEKGASLGVDDKIVVVAGDLTNSGTISLDKEGTGNTLIDLYVGNVTNNGTLELGYGNTAVSNNIFEGKLGTVENTGIIKLNNVSKDELENVKYEDVVGSLFEGEYIHTGLVVDKNGDAIISKDTAVIDDDISAGDLIGMKDQEGNEKTSVTMVGGSITGSENVVELKSLNVVDKVYVFNDKAGNGLNIDKTTINMDKDGVLSSLLGNMNLSDVIVNKADGEGPAIELNISSLNLSGNSTINGDIDGVSGSVATTGTTTINGNINVFGLDLSGDKNIINGNVNSNITNIDAKYTYLNGNMNFVLGNIGSINLGRTSEKTTVIEGSTTSSMSGNLNMSSDSQIIVNIGENGENILSNSTNLTLFGKENVKDEIKFITSGLTGEKITIDIAGNSFTNIEGITDSNIYILGNNGILDGQTSIDIVYNNNLFGYLDPVINNINTQIKGGVANGYFTGDTDLTKRAEEINRLYSSNIYSETVRAAYQNVKTTESSVLNIPKLSASKELNAIGVVLTERTKHDKDGRLNKTYESEIETSGLMAGLEYGVNDTTSVGAVFSGSKQNIDTDGGDADGDVFYIGTYAKKEVGKLSLTAGLGYQLGKYDANNTAALKSSNDSYDVNAYSVYAQGKYNIDLGDNLTFAPKLKLGYTYVDQDNVSDDYFKLNDAELSTFDAEVGADLVKTVTLEAGKLDVKFGASYVRAFGDTDNKFTGSFVEGGSFDVLGAELAEDTAKFDLGVEVTKDSGVFYNVGGTLRVGSDNTRDYGVKLGAGYKF